MVKPDQKIRILLVLPNGRIHKLKFGSWQISFREAPLTATTLAALIPPEIDANVTIIDESIEPLHFQHRYDLVGISCITGASTRAYQIADRFRAQGTTVVLGGVHVTLRPEEAAHHADAIVVGPAEDTWGKLLGDFLENRLQPVYRSEIVHLDHLPHPRRDLQRRFGYMAPNTIFATRGCKGTCDFCTIPALKVGWHKRPTIREPSYFIGYKQKAGCYTLNGNITIRNMLCFCRRRCRHRNLIMGLSGRISKRLRSAQS